MTERIKFDVNTRSDLEFKPVVNHCPQALSPHEIETYNREGFVAPIDIFSPDEAQRNRDYFDQLLGQVLNRGAYSIDCYQARCEGIWDLCTTPRILDYVQDIIGPDIICWASHFFCKMPHDPKSVPWHQDASYWHLSPARTVTVWLAIDDADEQNAAMRFIPRTHNRGPLKIRKSGDGNVLRYETIAAEDMGAPHTNALRAGQISLHADMLVHGSLPNQSSRRRCGLTIRYCPPSVDFTNAEWAKYVEPIICRGSASSDRWKHSSRPTGNDVSVQNSPRSLGGN